MSGKISSILLCSIYVETYFNEQKLSAGTAFLYKHKDTNKFYIITNWHVVSGKNNISQELLSKNGAIPNKIRVFLHKKGALGYWHNGDINLYDDIHSFEGKRWLEHPIHNMKVDVVAIPIVIPEECENYNIVEELIHHDYAQDYKSQIGDDVFILGYPSGIKGGGFFPIWKSGTIASEPVLEIDELPLFYIDAASREGMSGSAVIVKKARYISLYNGTASSYYQTALLGIYSGRLGVDEFGHAVGRVWKARVIDEIIEAR